MLLRFIIGFSAVCVTVYLSTAFVAWSFNPGDWTISTRALAVFTAGFFGVPCGIIAAGSRP